MKFTSHTAAFVQNRQHLITVHRIKIIEVTDDNKKLIKSRYDEVKCN